MENTKVFTNFIWRFLERCGAQGVTFIVSIVLARLLDPAVYGTVALVTVFTTIMQVFIDSGFGVALIQKKDADDLDFSSVFFFNISMCIFLYALMFFAAPLIARFYDKPELTPMVRVLSLTLIISGVKNVQQAYVSRNMLFRKFFFATLGGTLGAAVIGIWMAYKGYGVWALITQQLFNAAVDTAILWITVKWRPKAVFSFERLKVLLSYGWKLLASGLLDTLYNNLTALIIGKMYTDEDLAFFNKGERFPEMIVSNINASIDSVILPALSAEQDDAATVKRMTRKAITVSTYIMMPMMMGLAVCAEPIVSLILTDKWLPCVPFLRVFCFTYAFYPIHTANLNAIKAMGRSDIFLKLEIIKKLIGLAGILTTMWISVKAMAYILPFNSIVCQMVNAHPNKKLLNYSYGEQLKDMLPQIVLSCIMGALVLGISYLSFGNGITLLLQIPAGIAVYVIGSKLLKIEPFYYLLDILKKYFSKKHDEEAEV